MSCLLCSPVMSYCWVESNGSESRECIFPKKRALLSSASPAVISETVECIARGYLWKVEWPPRMEPC